MRPAALLVTLASAGCVAWLGLALSGHGESREGGARAYTQALIASDRMAGALAAWGVDPREIARDVDALSQSEVERLAAALEQLAGDGAAGGADAQALYLMLVAQLRDPSPYASLLSRFLRS